MGIVGTRGTAEINLPGADQIQRPLQLVGVSPAAIIRGGDAALHGAREHAVLRDRIVAIHAAAHGTYGAPAFTPSLQPRASTWAANAWRSACALRA